MEQCSVPTVAVEARGSAVVIFAGDTIIGGKHHRVVNVAIGPKADLHLRSLLTPGPGAGRERAPRSRDTRLRALSLPTTTLSGTTSRRSITERPRRLAPRLSTTSTLGDGRRRAAGVRFPIPQRLHRRSDHDWRAHRRTRALRWPSNRPEALAASRPRRGPRAPRSLPLGGIRSCLGADSSLPGPRGAGADARSGPTGPIGCRSRDRDRRGDRCPLRQRPYERCRARS
jgi:hypothetical protein